MPEMPKMPARPENPTGIVAHIIVDGCTQAIEFYKKAFGAEELMRMPAQDGKRIMHAALRIGRGVVFLADDFPEYCGGKSRTPLALQGTPVTLHQYVADCDAAIRRAQEAGATVRMAPMDMFWGDRYGLVIDPSGHQWAFATRVQELAPQEIQEGMKAAFVHGPKG